MFFLPFLCFLLPSAPATLSSLTPCIRIRLELNPWLSDCFWCGYNCTRLMPEEASWDVLPVILGRCTVLRMGWKKEESTAVVFPVPDPVCDKGVTAFMLMYVDALAGRRCVGNCLRFLKRSSWLCSALNSTESEPGGGVQYKSLP